MFFSFVLENFHVSKISVRVGNSDLEFDVASGTAIVWLRKDLRIRDNQALQAACQFSQVLPVYIWPPDGKWPLGEASQWWLHHSLLALQDSLREKGSDLYVFSGNVAAVFSSLLSTVRPEAVFWNRLDDPTAANQESLVRDALQDQDVSYQVFQGNLLCEYEELLKDDGKPYQVYTPFWRKFARVYEPRVIAAPRQIPPVPQKVLGNQSIKQLKLLPKINWASGFNNHWEPGEKGALARLQKFLKQPITVYNTARDQPAVDGTSRLSPHLHFGEIHPQLILYKIVQKYGPLHLINDKSIQQYCKEVVWREFSYHLLQHFPNTPTEPLKDAFAGYPWSRKKSSRFVLWTRGQTGYPFVDAGMRELWTTGWMHNRVRMVVASFLVKHLNIGWQLGAEWFWDTLVDADIANNTQGWQWTAGCGADASPFFRIFNPITQGEKFDPGGEYVRRWCPELKNLPNKWIYRPWEAPQALLASSGVNLGENYPKPLVDHVTARKLALENYQMYVKS